MEGEEGALGRLPEDLLVYIFSFFDEEDYPRSLCAVGGVCRQWRKAAANPAFEWNRIVVLDQHTPSSPAPVQLLSPRRGGSAIGTHSSSSISSSPQLLGSPGRGLSKISSSSQLLSFTALTPPREEQKLRTSSPAFLNSRSRSRSTGAVPQLLVSGSSIASTTTIAAPEKDPPCQRFHCPPVDDSKVVVDRFVLKLSSPSDLVCRSCIFLQPQVPPSTTPSSTKSRRPKKPEPTPGFRLRILKLQLVKFSEDSLHCGCYLVERSAPVRQLYCRFSCVFGLNPIHCDLGKECGDSVFGEDIAFLSVSNWWSGLSLAITEVVLQGRSLQEVVFCLLDDKQRVAQLQQSIEDQKRREKEAQEAEERKKKLEEKLEKRKLRPVSLKRKEARALFGEVEELSSSPPSLSVSRSSSTSSSPLSSSPPSMAMTTFDKEKTSFDPFSEDDKPELEEKAAPRDPYFSIFESTPIPTPTPSSTTKLPTPSLSSTKPPTPAILFNVNTPDDPENEGLAKQRKAPLGGVINSFLQLFKKPSSSPPTPQTTSKPPPLPSLPSTEYSLTEPPPPPPPSSTTTTTRRTTCYTSVTGTCCLFPSASPLT